VVSDLSWTMPSYTMDGVLKSDGVKKIKREKKNVNEIDLD